MSRAKTYDELLESLEGTPYYKILSLYRPEENGRIRLTEIENALYRRLVETLYAIIDGTKGAVSYTHLYTGRLQLLQRPVHQGFVIHGIT